MARQRKIIQESAKSERGTRSSSSNGSTSPSTKTKQKKTIFSYWKQIIVAIVTGIAICFGYIGYLETRVNTPFDDQKVAKNSLNVPEQFWGSYRPGLYLGFKTRDPHSMVTGLMWYFPNRLKPGGDGIRHWCEQGDNLQTYGWLQHDGMHFGVQEIEDVPFQLNTSFVKRSGGSNGGDWTARIHANVLPQYKEVVDKNEEISLIWYAALDTETGGFIAPTNSGTDITGIRGSTTNLGDFSIKLFRHQGEIQHESFVSVVTPGLHLLKETVTSSLRLSQESTDSQRKIILGGDLIRGENKQANFVAIQVTAKLPFILDVAFESHSYIERDKSLIGKAYTNALQWHQSRFNQRFEDTFGLKKKGYDEREIKFAKAALSNMVGSIGYFYGSSLVQSFYTKEPVNYWKAPLFTSVPSRSFFPRGFLWDEGFHGLLISQWDLDLELDIMSYWFDLLNVEGWIPRELILGAEAVAKVPQEYMVQWNTNANPPTFFLTLQSILDKYEQDLSNERLALLERLFPRLQAWFLWFNSTQRGPLPGSYRWRGRDPLTNRELNPKTMASGLDDFPRSSHPTDLERHIDLYCWMAIAADTMARLAKLLGRENFEKYQQTSDFLKDNRRMDSLHWSNFSERYADYGLHTDAVKLERPKSIPRQPNQNLEMVRAVLKPPEYRLVDTTFGYVNIFPLILQIIAPDSPKLEKTIRDMRDSELLWTKFGLRSLGKTSPLYLKRNTEHDPPYWRGQIWININFLACRALYHYSNTEGPYREQANKVYQELRNNVINNVIRQYYKTGYLWEQYNDKTGEGSGCRPFTGWTALVVLLMSEKY
ncbi:mannosyl-oligosaccharide glucosidase [Cylas formicarius]|uniref:mannosyl-oligosaccharide glucosidase n=1 Tax=Cylas formicarius TaxID=197179 RepID=UPI002958D9F5|nr:mannosyl-oligosaccharide glucosidase [Cylas formicarius]